MPPLHLPTLLIAAAAVLLVSGAGAAVIGVRQKLRRGVWWWIGANAALALGIAGQAFGDAPAWLPPASALLALQWPLVTLSGLRRFYARGHGIPPWSDAIAAALAAVAVVWTAAAPMPWPPAPGVFAAAMLGLTVYAAAVVVRLDDFANMQVLKAILCGLVASAALQATWLALAGAVLDLGGGGLAVGALLAPAACALLLPQLSLVMNHERAVANLRAAQRRLRHMVEVDALTRLPHRSHFHELAARAIQQAPELATVVVFDVERLQHLNDVLGQAIGDEALRQVGNALRETLRRRDVAGRIGGDEFAVVLPRTRVDDSDPVIARIDERIDDRQVAPRIARFRLNASATQMRAGETVADALRRAEQSLRAKRERHKAVGRDEERTLPLGPAARSPAANESQPGFGASTGAAALNLIPVGDIVPEAN